MSAGKANVTLLNLKQGLERELSVTLDGVKSGELNIILTALDFGEKKPEEAVVYTKSRSEHPPLPVPASLAPGAPKSPRPKSPSAPELQPQV